MIPLNVQPIEKQVSDENGWLQVVDIWHTIQGEGPFAGKPAVFIRLAGCNLQCPNCDTNYTLGRASYSPADIIERVLKLFDCPQWVRDMLVVITGGEPFRQDIIPLMVGLVEKGIEVQIETNGTLYPAAVLDLWVLNSPRVTIVCSPKAGKISDKLLKHINAFKYVLSSKAISEVDGLPTSVLGNGISPARPPKDFNGEVYIQPCDVDEPTQNAANIKAAVDSCLKWGYTLCLQTHKYAGLK